MIEMAGRSGRPTVSVRARVAVRLEASAAWTVKLNVPASVGVPSMVPAAPLSESGGQVSLTRLKEYGALPPDADKSARYAEPAVAEGNWAGVEMLSPAAMESVNCF